MLLLLVRVAADGDDADRGAGGVGDDDRLPLPLPGASPVLGLSGKSRQVGVMKFQIYKVLRPRDAKDQETDWREKFQGTIRQPRLIPNSVSVWLASIGKRL